LGGAGFLGSTLVDELVQRRKATIVVDNLSRGSLANISAALSSGSATFAYGDIVDDPDGVVRSVARASPTGIATVYDFTRATGGAATLAASLEAGLVVVRPGPIDRRFRSDDGCIRVVEARNAFGPRMDITSALGQLFAARAARESCLQAEWAEVPMVLTFSRRIAHAVANLPAGRLPIGRCITQPAPYYSTTPRSLIEAIEVAERFRPVGPGLISDVCATLRWLKSTDVAKALA
jgi:hypothetical protein